MYKQRFGKRKQMRFTDEAQYFETLGFLAKSDGSTELSWEKNNEQGAWGPEGRIHCYSNLVKFPKPLSDKFTKGRGKRVLHRINCSEFVLNLINNHKFEWGTKQDVKTILTTIPHAFFSDFNRGLSL